MLRKITGTICRHRDRADEAAAGCSFILKSVALDAAPLEGRGEA
ncbi:MAG: hypothetical protein ACRDKY_04515 [Solirubrobacteraceae bacterium]